VCTQDELVESCLRLVQRVAGEFASQHSGSSFDDLVGEGHVGLVQAAQKFEPERGVRFSTFAAPRIRGAIIDALRRENLLSRPMAELVVMAKARQDELCARLGREPTQEEIAGELRLTPERAREVMALRSLRVSSLEAHGADLGFSCEDGRDSPEELAMQAQLGLELQGYLNRLRPGDREILKRIYWWHQKHIEVAADLGISASRVSQRRTRALILLREMMAEDGRVAGDYLRQAA
jgi:RNA polymerase sigma factor for flagellar operon FliA